MKILQGLLIFVLSVSVFAGDEFKAGKKAFQQGNFEKALEKFSNVRENILSEKLRKILLNKCEKTSQKKCDEILLKECRKLPSEKCDKKLLEEKIEEYINASLYLARAYQALGRVWEAYGILDDSLDLYKGKESSQIRAKVFMQLSDFYVEMRNFNRDRGSCEMNDVIDTAIGKKKSEIISEDMLKSASDYLDKALANLLETDYLLKAEILNRQGNILFLQSKYKEALELYNIALTNLTNNKSDEQEKILEVKIELNFLQSTINNG